MSGELEQPEREELELPTVLAALADPYRLACVCSLAQHGPTSCSDLFERIPIKCTKSTGSHHLGVLRAAGVISMRVSGVHRYSTLRRTDLDARFPGLLDAVLAAQNELGMATPRADRHRDG
jgi:DNA-binding transcriptional ArsR family regulator